MWRGVEGGGGGWRGVEGGGGEWGGVEGGGGGGGGGKRLCEIQYCVSKGKKRWKGYSKRQNVCTLLCKQKNLSEGHVATGDKISQVRVQCIKGEGERSREKTRDK